MSKILMFFFFFIAIGCGKNILSHDKLSIDRVNYIGNELKISGYFYYKYSTSADNLYSIYFLYSNGIVMHGGATKESNLLTLETEFQNGIYYNKIKDSRYHWGVFRIENDIIKIERWYPSSGGKLRAYVREGIILNDTSFVIKEFYRDRRGKKKDFEELQENYYFKNFSPKPDSTNKYVD
jgi:hypothetical protein